MVPRSLCRAVQIALSSLLLVTHGFAADEPASLLDVLLENGTITREQYDQLRRERSDDPEGEPQGEAEEGGQDGPTTDESDLAERVDRAVQDFFADSGLLNARYTPNGLLFESRDGNFATTFQFRMQFRFTWPTEGDPRTLGGFADTEEATLAARRIRMKVGGHAPRPWLKYFFEIDFQPISTAETGPNDTRILDYRIDVDKFEQFGIRAGVWKIDYNRERVESSGRQQFVERSIVNRTFTIDRQVGVSFHGRFFSGTPADLRYYLGIFTGEGRGAENDDEDMMYVARVQWNFLGRDLKLRQTDVERSPDPIAALAFGAAHHTGRCTRWSSSGCGNLDGYLSPGVAADGQYRITQAVQELSYKHQGFSFQQEFHWKRIRDRSLAVADARHDTDLYGLYVQAGYFWGELFECIPEELELAFRYAVVREPNPVDVLETNLREEFTAGANWFFRSHENKVTVDYSYLTLDDDVTAFGSTQDHRVRVQWDVSF